MLLTNSQWCSGFKHIYVAIQLLSIRFLMWSCSLFYWLQNVDKHILCMWIPRFSKYFWCWDTAAPIFVTWWENRIFSILKMKITRHKESKLPKVSKLAHERVGTSTQASCFNSEQNNLFAWKNMTCYNSKTPGRLESPIYIRLSFWKMKFCC